MKISSSGLKAENTIHRNGMNMRIEKMISMMWRGILARLEADRPPSDGCLLGLGLLERLDAELGSGGSHSV